MLNPAILVTKYVMQQLFQMRLQKLSVYDMSLRISLVMIVVTTESTNGWSIICDQSPLHKLCYESPITTQKINPNLYENCNDSLAIDSIHGMTPLHMLVMNPFASADCLSALLDSRMEAIFRLDNKQKTPLDCARNYNVGGLVGMIVGLWNHRNSSIALVERDANHVWGILARFLRATPSLFSLPLLKRRR